MVDGGSKSRLMQCLKGGEFTIEYESLLDAFLRASRLLVQLWARN